MRVIDPKGEKTWFSYLPDKMAAIQRGVIWPWSGKLVQGHCKPSSYGQSSLRVKFNSAIKGGNF